ncbi:membrane component of an ABC superfamily lipid transporter [Wigglesworthia glossinidia endosymbiont of Glossina morsitans morsitans (Yale colony)]|uniref:ABC-type xenobiotic transporter n=1 Tax=Wigglesworthia glossinidia endosymbiont of Glossina morsitans morsitans (Yale colony) TaxID=1142511 RepID=H6Q562_WIGGL|nr:lipid A ABC transporter ATP-binding protein/permease MsbA [Wigglesworthia glossinidia]AFA41345.1 membrane component of an ABC superfamily lipid transporter [Wigglesworthia glossinidia endosymbiont of Glossina morsitans morsitans (Yale colony)]
MSKKNFSTWRIFCRLWSIISPFKGGLIIATIALIINATSDTLMLSLLKPLLDDGFKGLNNIIPIWMPLTIIVLMCSRGSSGFISNYCLSWVSGKVVMRMRKNLFQHIMQMPVSFFDRKSTGTLLSHITYDTEQVASSSSSVLITVVREGSLIIGLFFMIFYHSWQLSSILIVITPIVFFFIKYISKKFRKINKKIQNNMGMVTNSAEQMLKGHKEIRIFGGQKKESERFNYFSNFMRQQSMKVVVASAGLDVIIQFIASLALAGILYIASLPKVIESLTAGTITVIFSSMIALMRPLKSLTNVNSHFQKGMVACQTLFSILDIQKEQDYGSLHIKRARGEIKFKNVTFTYPGKTQPSLKNINIKISAGYTVALIGSSGSGKSTLINLLTRFYDANQGTIFLDNIDLKKYKLDNLRNQMALVSQNVYLFNDTIANNIAYAKKDIYSKKQIEKAASMAYAMNFIIKMKNGLNTIIGENGTLLSGGQRQRIAIARALLRDCPILILDEATSALDIESEIAIQKALNKLKKNRTSLIIAHRISTIKKSDIILLVENGKIIEHGNHHELMELQGTYAHMHYLQLGK